MNKLIDKIIQLDAQGENNEYLKQLKKIVIKAVVDNEPLNFICFTCSTINPKYLFSNTPWLYVSTDPTGNNLTHDIERLKSIIAELKAIYPRVELKIIIGNTDPYYIYLEQFKNFSGQEPFIWQKFIERWDSYQENFENWIGFPVINWYRMEKLIEAKQQKSFEQEYLDFKAKINNYFTPNQLAWEFRKLETQFAPGAYFAELIKPSDELLQSWIRRKFSEYAIQGKWLYENIPNAILIQNEKPSDLRSQMYQPAINQNYQDVLPIVYFLGVDNIGYQ